MEEVKPRGYDVFVSFSGDDTRNGFVSRLCKKLNRGGLSNWRELKGGLSVSPSLFETIEKSKSSILVLSASYAFSSHCTVATIAGWDSQKCFDGKEAYLVEFVVGDVLDRLSCMRSEAQLVGINYRMRIVDKMLGSECNDVRMIGICGMGGVGKTTIADFIYQRDLHKYEACCFLKSIKDRYVRDGGAIALRRELLYHILSEKNSPSWDEDVVGDAIHKKLRSKKVLLVLDDIGDLDQLKNLANDIRWFGQGSRIIITT